VVAVLIRLFCLRSLFFVVAGDLAAAPAGTISSMASGERAQGLAKSQGSPLPFVR